MVVRFVVLLLSSLTIAFRIEPALAFSSIQCKLAATRVRHGDRSTRLYSAANGDAKRDPSVFSRCLKSLAVTATSLQILSAGHVGALPLPPAVDEAVVSQSVASSAMKTKLPDVKAMFNTEFDLNPISDEFLKILPRFPLAGSKLLTTTVRPDMENQQRQNQQFEEMKKIQWWKNTGVNIDKLTEDIQSQIDNLPDEISHIGDKVKSGSANWKILSGVIGIFFVADILQHSKQLSKQVDEQNVKLAEQETKLETSNTMNTETIDLLKAESMKLIEEVDSMIKEVDDKALRMSHLNETLQALSLTVNNTDAQSRQMLTQYTRQLESAETLIKSLKSQIVEIPRKVAREVATDYKNQIAMSEKENAALKLEIIRIEEQAKSNKGPSAKYVPSKVASVMPNFPPISSSFPTSIFSPPVNPLVAKNEMQSVEINEMKAKVTELEERNKEGNAKTRELEGQIAGLLGTLSATEKSLGEKKSEESAYFQELNARLTAMEGQIRDFMVENGELKAKLLLAETESKMLREQAHERDTEAASVRGPTAAEVDENNAKNVLLSQLSRENDDLKQRLLSTDAQLMDLQEDNLNKLEAAKIMTKQLNARLTEIGVQQENKDGKMMLQVKELEEAKEAIVKQLSEAQSALADLSASPPPMKPAQIEAKADTAEKAAKAIKPKAKKATEKVSAKQAALDSLAGVKPYQMMKKSKKELEEILKAIGGSPPASALPLSKSALLDLITEHVTASVKI